MRIEINRRQLLAALCLAGKEDVRPYLNGVYVEATLTETRLTATDGRVLGVQRHAETNDCAENLIIPRSVAERVKGANGLNVWLEKPVGGGWSLFADGAQFPFTPIDGVFPDYRRVLSLVKSPSGEAGHYDPTLLGAFQKAGKLLGHKCSIPILRQNGRSGALLHFYGDDAFVGVCMVFDHFTEKRPDLGFPTWGS